MVHFQASLGIQILLNRGVFIPRYISVPVQRINDLISRSHIIYDYVGGRLKKVLGFAQEHG